MTEWSRQLGLIAVRAEDQKDQWRRAPEQMREPRHLTSCLAGQHQPS